MSLADLYSDIVREHSASNHNKRHLQTPSVVSPGSNPSCGDEISLELYARDGIILDGGFTGTGCAISQASVSIMIDLVQGKSIAEARALAASFLAMCRREPLTSGQLESLEEAAALGGVADMPARVKCAGMPWHTMLTALDALENTEK